MNEMATITAVKETGPVKTLTDAISTIVHSADLNSTQKTDAVDATVSEFREAYTKAAPVIEVKEGRVLSSATKEKIKMARGHMKSADDIFNTLLAEDEADDTLDEGDDTLKAAAALETKSEPVPDHSAAERIARELAALYRTA